LVAEAEWDLVIVDEAHHARRHLDEGPNLAYQLLEAMRDRIGGLLLLTATPMQLHDYELYSMVELVEPGLFDDYGHFGTSRREIAEINAQLGWLRLGPGRHDQRQSLRWLLDEWDAPTEVATADVNSAAERRLVVEWLESRHLLSRALVRNRKAEVGEFMKREAKRLPVEPTDEELALERDVQDYLRRQYVMSPALGLVLVTFQKLLASSSRALASAIDTRISKLRGAQDEELNQISDDPEIQYEVEEAWRHAFETDEEIRELRDLAARARQIEDTKLDVLESELDTLFAEEPSEKVLIFTQYLGTLEMICERLAPKFRVATFHGGMSRAEKDEAHRAFKSHTQVLISSEAGGEGRNFQFCHILFNYDLPWNPMRIEQRIGRIDRVGQKRNVLVYNFGVEGTLDERILEILENRIKVFTESVGALEPILGEVEAQIKRIVLQDAQTALQELRRYEVDLETRLDRARTREEQMGDFVLDARSFRRDEVEELLGRDPMATPEDLRAFVCAGLAYYPTGAIRDEGGGVYTFVVPGVLCQRNGDLDDEYRGTFAYRVALEDETLDFFAFGHPLVEALVEATCEDGAVPPLGALPTGNGEGYLVDYEIRFSGVREREQLVTHAVGCDSPEQPHDLHAETEIAPMGEEEAFELELASRTWADEETAKRFDAFRAENEQMHEAERERLEKRFAFQRRFYEKRIEDVQARIDRLTQYGTESERTILPALRGQIDRHRQRIAQVEEERRTALEHLDLRQEPSYETRVLAVTRLLQRSR
jgi:superfamily II DNA or RNA helicase